MNLQNQMSRTISEEIKMDRRVKWWIAFFTWILFLSYWYNAMTVIVVGKNYPESSKIHFYIFNGIWISISCIYFSTIFTPPQEIPEEYEIKDRQNISKQIKELQLERFKICESCSLIKPPRSHHCRQCDRCVLKMDHHCPVLQTCIHHHNQKFYLLYLFFPFSLGCFGVEWMWRFLMRMAIQVYHTNEMSIDQHLVVGALSNAIMTVIGVAWLLRHQLHQLFTNRTTIEQAIIEDLSVEEPKTNLEIYDLGDPYSNLISVMGPAWWLWFLPVNNTPGDGIHYEHRVVRAGRLKWT